MLFNGRLEFKSLDFISLNSYIDAVDAKNKEDELNQDLLDFKANWPLEELKKFQIFSLDKCELLDFDLNPKF